MRLLAVEVEGRVRRPPLAAVVAVAVAVPYEVEPCRGPELDEIELGRSSTTHGLEDAGKEYPASLHLVRLHSALLDPLPEKLPVHDQSVVDSLPCRSTAEHEVVNAREQTQRRIPDR